jgi:hypothetical protein
MGTQELPSDISWPPKPPKLEEADFAKMLYQAQLDIETAKYQAQIDEIKAQWRDQATTALELSKLEKTRQDNATAEEDKLREAVHAAYLEVAKGTLDRALKRADFITGVAGAIGTSYAALLALVYSTSSEPPTPLPGRGIVPALFLGLSFLLSAFYVAFIRPGSLAGQYLPSGVGGTIQEDRMLFFLKWVTEGAMQRAWALRTAVISLAVGVALIPLPFLQLSDNITLTLSCIGALVVIVSLVYELVSSYRTGNAASSASKPPTQHQQ